MNGSRSRQSPWIARAVGAASLAVALAACGGADDDSPANVAGDGGSASLGGDRISAPKLEREATTEAPSLAGNLWQGTVQVEDTPTADTALAQASAPEALAMTMEALMALAPTNTVEATVTRTPRPSRTPRPPRVSSRGGSSGGSSSRSAPTRTPRDSDRPTATPDRSGNATPGPNLPRDTEVPAPAGPTSPPAPTVDNSLLGQLRRGGLVIYLRHTRTNWDQSERELVWIEEVKQDISNRSLYDQCDRQRLLNGEGKDQARAIGDTLRSLEIPVGRVVTSPWCRTRETAQLAFGGGDADLDKVFDTGYLPSGSSERKHYKEALRGLLSSSPGGGTNTVIVGHMPQLQDATGVTLQEAEAAIFRPEGGYKLLHKNISPGEWEGLSRR